MKEMGLLAITFSQKPSSPFSFSSSNHAKKWYFFNVWWWIIENQGELVVIVVNDNVPYGLKEDEHKREEIKKIKFSHV
jgi:hypothetical protein